MDVAAPARGSWRRTLWGGLLSLIQPGLGHIYAHSWRLGIALYLVEWAIEILIITLTWVAPPTPYPLAAAVVMFSTFRLAVAIDTIRRIRAHSERVSVRWYRSTWFAAIVMIGIDTGLGFAIHPRDMIGWKTYSISSASNMPTLFIGDYVATDIRHPGMQPAYGDMVVFRFPRDPQVDYVKRVVGLPGDRVQIRKGVLYLNDKPIPRESIGFFAMFSAPPSAGFKKYRETLPNSHSYSIIETSEKVSADNTIEYYVPPQSLFVLGDNRDNSLDSRLLDNFGYVPLANVIGIARTIYWSNDPFRILSRVE